MSNYTSADVQEWLAYLAAEAHDVDAQPPHTVNLAGDYDPAEPVFTTEQVRMLLAAPTSKGSDA